MMTKKRKIEFIIIHCSDSRWGDKSEIDNWHKARGWSGIGYHHVILNGHRRPNNYKFNEDGLIEEGRSHEVAGAHAEGYNSNSLGICLIGKDDFTERQLKAMYQLLKLLMTKYKIPIEKVIGHYETASGRSQGKTCPNMPMDQIRAALGG
jgi:N-acetylmuramoyl-L-alanine amidase